MGKWSIRRKNDSQRGENSHLTSAGGRSPIVELSFIGSIIMLVGKIQGNGVFWDESASNYKLPKAG